MGRAQGERRALDRLAIPAIIAGIAEPLIGLIDTAFVGRLGTADLAAVGIATSFFLLVVWVLAQTRSAILAVVARYFGRNDLYAIQDLVPLAIWMNFALGLSFFAITSFFAEPIFSLYNAEGEVLHKAVAYYRIRSIGHPIVLATFALSGVFRGLQNTSWSMWAGILGALVNIALDPWFIFGGAGVPAMGIEGSAWASVLAQCVMLAYSLLILYTRTPFRILPKRWSHPELGGLVGLSGNLFIRTISLNVAYFLGNRFATGYGDAHIAAHSIAMQVWLFSAFFIDGYAAAGSVLAGKFAGQGDTVALYRTGRQVMWRSVWIGAALAVCMLMGYSWMASGFTSDGTVITLFNGIFWMVLLTQPINAVAFAYDGLLKGLGAGGLLRNTLLITTFFLFVPTIFLGDRLGWGLHGVWTAFLVWMIGRGWVLTSHFERRYHPTRSRVRSSVPGTDPAR
ncbi:MAG: MATE family efflux transporter [Flavobacteriales bacterium]|nr:MATE family efflux transporter [Flavobacteriales bacterium]